MTFIVHYILAFTGLCSGPGRNTAHGGLGAGAGAYSGSSAADCLPGSSTHQVFM